MKRLISALLAIFTVAALICVPVVTVSAEDPTPDPNGWNGTDKSAGFQVKDPTKETTTFGTSENPYLITSAKDLFLFQQIINKKVTDLTKVYVVKADGQQICNLTQVANIIVDATNDSVNGNDFNAANFEQTADIDLNNQPWNPIGQGSSYYFIGTYDGGNYEITGLYIKPMSGAAADKVGLFGFAANANDAAEFKNMTVKGQISYTCTTATQNVKIGGIVGYGKHLVFENCHTDVDITLDTNATGSAYTYVGGLVGHCATASQSTLTVKDCVAEGDITFTANGNQFYVGGLVGYANGGKADLPKTISNSYFTGKIVIDKKTSTGEPAEAGSLTAVGGIAGTLLNNATAINNCHMLGTVTVINMTPAENNKIALFVGDWGAATASDTQCTITNSSCLVPPSSSNDVDEFDNVLGAARPDQTTAANITTITNNTATVENNKLTLRAVQDKKVDADNISVRFLATISAADLATVDTIGFKVSAIAPDGETGNKDIALDTVYKSLNVGATNAITATDIAGNEGDYIAGLVINEIPTTGTIALAVQTYYTVDSETVYGATNIVFYNNGEYVGYTTPTMGDIAD